MLIFDQLTRNDPQLRLLARIVLAGMLVLLIGLWWVQVVSSRYYRQKLEVQSIRTVRIPAVRGSILDREGRPLAENRPSFNICLFLEDLSKRFQTAALQAQSQLRKQLIAQEEARLKRPLTTRERRKVSLPPKLNYEFQMLGRYLVASNLVTELSGRLGEPVNISEKQFRLSYEGTRALPVPVLPNVGSNRLARFEEQSTRIAGMDLDVQSVRSYSPAGQRAVHLLGYVVRSSGGSEDDEIPYNYRLEDYSGVTGIEKLFDPQLRGKPGAKSVLVNNFGYRQGENVWSPAEPGHNVFLTIDNDIQKAAHDALGHSIGAVVVMDPRNGDVLALVSSPTFDPNFFTERHDATEWAKMNQYLNDEMFRPQINRATYENYLPGSIFKIFVGLAALEVGALDPTEQYDSTGYYMVAGTRFDDTAGAGKYDLNRAMAKSSNPYFIHLGLKKGVLAKVIELGQRLHLGQRTRLLPGQDAPGHFPDKARISSAWFDGDTGNLSIGQGAIDVTPVQVAVMISAVANGGTVFWPRVVARTEPQDGLSQGETYPEGRMRDNLRVNPRNLELICRAMREDVISPEGTGRGANIPDWPAAGKTGTAQVEKHGRITREAQQTWFVSFAPYSPIEKPRYVVVATVQGGDSGGTTCVPIVRKIYEAIQLKEKRAATRTAPLARTP